MTQGHTEGPWHLGAGGGARFIYDQRGWPIGDVQIYHGKFTEGEVRANATLIAAAPELLSIVKRFVALPSGAWHLERNAAEEDELLEEARAAIAKATGGQS